MPNLSFKDKWVQESLEHIERATRVLAALTQNRDPDPDDIAELRRFAPESEGKTTDAVICGVLNKILKQHNPVDG